MRRVTGIGGIFFKARDVEAMRLWYQTHLGIDVQEWGGATFSWAGDDGQLAGGTTAWNVSSADSRDYEPGTSAFMINYRVADLDALLGALRAEGCNVLGSSEDSEYGKFGWLLDPEGNKVELWQPPPGQ
jgi:predicted enzyme related to lactoylglutathione lyase